MTAATIERPTLVDGEELRLHPELSPFQGVTKHAYAHKVKAWKPSKTDTLESIQHVMLNELTYRDRADNEYGFWSLAPIQPGIRRGDEIRTHEFVWLLSREDQGDMYHALAHRETGEISWHRFVGSYVS